MKNLTFLFSALFFFSGMPVFADGTSSLAESHFKTYLPALYQVESVSVQSNKKNSVGTGFQISKAGHIVTNYHVVSDAVISPELFHIRVFKSDGSEQSARVVHFDVIHDLAIIEIKAPSAVIFPLGSSEMSNGKKLFSIGNPLDLGMTIMEGLSNGYMDKSLYKKMLTTLSLNHGMSGGPTIDEDGVVVGVNVATAGNELSFLVPVEFLKTLWLKVQANGAGFSVASVGEVEPQLITQETAYIKDMINQRWEKQNFGDFIVPTVISKEFTCWGSPGDNVGYWLKDPNLQCEIQDDIFISSSVSAHSISFNYAWVESRGYDPMRFYYLTDRQVSHGYHFELDRAGEKDVENFKCRSDLVEIGHNPFWVSTCARQLKKLPHLYDVNVRMASLGEAQGMLMVELTLGGLTRASIKTFVDKFYREIQWQK